MGYAVKISLRDSDTNHAVYEWESTTGRQGYIRLDTAARRFEPVDDAERPIGKMSFTVNDGDVSDPDPDTVQDFMTVVVGILRKWKTDEPLPTTAHRYFG